MPELKAVYLIAAKRTPVTPVKGAQRHLSLTDLALPVVAACCQQAELPASAIEGLILGNALGAGGNPARLLALAAGLPNHSSCLTVDSQCCSGLDALRLAASLIASGQHQILLAGGSESYSQRPLRARSQADGQPLFYLRPPFTPWPERDPDMLVCAACLAQSAMISEDEQLQWAVRSHAWARSATQQMATQLLVSDQGLAVDSNSRDLSLAVAKRSRLLQGQGEFGLRAASVAQEADAAALVLMVSGEALARMPARVRVQAVRFRASQQQGSVPESPPTAIVPVAAQLLQQQGVSVQDLAVIEMMEAFAVQLLHNARALGIGEHQLNRWGGALARGHAIAASGAVLAVQAFGQLQSHPPGALALLAIAAAGGLANATLLEKL